MRALLEGQDLARVLRLLLAEAGMTRSELSVALGCSRANITQMLSGDRNMTVETVKQVASALGYGVHFEFYEER